MVEYELYKFCELRFRFLGNFKILAFFALFLLCVQSSAACYDLQRSVSIRSTYYCAATTGTYNFGYPVVKTLSVSGSCRCSANTFSPYDYNIQLTISQGGRILASASCSSSCGEENLPNNSYRINVVCDIVECENQTESDSVNCVQSGLQWANGVCKPPCDSSKWTCHTYTETSQTTVASDNITCIKGTCFGLTYCEYVTRNTTECDNECGTHTEQTNEIPMTYEGACNDDNLSDDNMCSATKCIEAQGQYSLYQMCQSRSVINGEIQLLPRMVGGGMGSCKNAGYKAENDKLNDSTSVAQDSMQIPLECYQYGVNCPEPDSSYSDPEDRTPQNGCICEPFDGQKYISQIVCPDGSSSILYSSCDEWKQPPMSSSSTPESSSAAEWPASSGGIGDMGDWTTYSQGEDIKAALAVIAANTSKMGNNQVIVQQNQEFLSQFAYQDDGTEPQLNVPDFMLSYDSTQVDTNGILDAIFNRLDTSNKVLDTIPTSTKVCPCLTFFQGNQNISFNKAHIQFKEIVIDFANFHGFNFCTIISAIVVALASVVSFFIGFSIFKNVSQ